MRQFTESYHVLQVRRKVGNEWNIWNKPVAGMFRPAELLAYQGHLIEAIEEAQRTQLREYGNMHGVEFRCLTKSTTVTIATGAIDESTLLGS